MGSHVTMSRFYHTRLDSCQYVNLIDPLCRRPRNFGHMSEGETVTLLHCTDSEASHGHCRLRTHSSNKISQISTNNLAAARYNLLSCCQCFRMRDGGNLL